MSHQFREIDCSPPITLPGNLEGLARWQRSGPFHHGSGGGAGYREIEATYCWGGSAPYPPKMLLALLFYCYAQGIFPAGRSSGRPTSGFRWCTSAGGYPSGSRQHQHVPPAVFVAIGGAVCAMLMAEALGGVEVGQCQSGWGQYHGQRPKNIATKYQRARYHSASPYGLDLESPA